MSSPSRVGASTKIPFLPLKLPEKGNVPTQKEKEETQVNKRDVYQTLAVLSSEIYEITKDPRADVQILRRLEVQREETLAKLSRNEIAQTELWRCFHNFNGNNIEEFKKGVCIAISHGADLNLCNKDGDLFLQFFCWNNHLLEFLLLLGADPYIRTGKDGNDAFFYFHVPANYKILKECTRQSPEFLLQHRNFNGDTIFTAFIKRKLSSEITREMIEFFLAEGFNINEPIIKENHYETILHYLARAENGNLALCYLSSACKKIDVKDSKGLIPLEQALIASRIENVTSLINRKSPVTTQHFEIILCKIPHGETFLSHPAKTLAQAVLANADFSQFAWSRFHFAAYCNHWPALIKPDDPNIESRDATKITPLHLSAKQEHLEATFCLLEAKASPLKADANGNLPGSLAAALGRKAIVDLLLDIYKECYDDTVRHEKVNELTKEWVTKLEEEYHAVEEGSIQAEKLAHQIKGLKGIKELSEVCSRKS